MNELDERKIIHEPEKGGVSYSQVDFPIHPYMELLEVLLCQMHDGNSQL